MGQFKKSLGDNMNVLNIDLFWETKKEAIEKINWFNDNVNSFTVKIDAVDPNSSLNKTKIFLIKELRNLGFKAHNDNDLIWYSHD